MVHANPMREFYMIRYTLAITSYNGYSTTADVANWLGISPRALRDWRRRGKGPKYDLWGARYLYKPQYLDDYIGQICAYLASGDATGLIPIAGTKLEAVIRQWIEAAGGANEKYYLAVDGPNRDVAALLVNRLTEMTFTASALR